MNILCSSTINCFSLNRHPTAAHTQQPTSQTFPLTSSFLTASQPTPEKRHTMTIKKFYDWYKSRSFVFFSSVFCFSAFPSHFLFFIFFLFAFCVFLSSIIKKIFSFPFVVFIHYMCCVFSTSTVTLSCRIINKIRNNKKK